MRCHKCGIRGVAQFTQKVKRHIHIIIIISAGGLRLSGKAERHARFIKEEATEPQSQDEKTVCVDDEPRVVLTPHLPLQNASKALSGASH
ncbi:MAG: hypothetical protein HQL48_00385 [Gammaproteobacteria bacterium]|nr:hypothetical protein [Gammaproteobacteria bacterium]